MVLYLSYFLFLCLQLILVGVCCSGGADGTDPYSEISLQPLPEYSIPSDGVTMTCIACTDKGRIFMAGRDGHIYELLYTTGSGWHKCCRKVCLTAGVGSLISRCVFICCFNTIGNTQVWLFWQSFQKFLISVIFLDSKPNMEVYYNPDSCTLSSTDVR